MFVHERALKVVIWAIGIFGTALLAYLLYTTLVGYGEQKARAELQTESQKVTEQASKTASEVQTARADSRIRIVTVTKEIVREVPVYLPAGTPDLPGGFRVLHDAAATGEAPTATSRADAPTVPAQEAASTVAENYGACRDTADQLMKLQQWVDGVSK